jgi:hypothetical protein
MKLPFDFSIALIFRLVFPGVILAAALLPGLQALLLALGIAIKFSYIFPVEVIACGWAIVVSDMTIYMLFEGRRYWPSCISELLTWCQQRRLDRLSAIVLDEKAEGRRFLEAGVEYALYPVDEHSNAYVAHPTRLGNIIASFETYPKVKYGLDAVFYWYRLWVVLDKELRDEIDTSQAVVDSSVYISFAFYLSAFVLLVYAGIGAKPDLYGLQWLSAIDLPYVPAPHVLCLMAAGCLIIGFVIYRLSLPAHAQYGEQFKSVFDQFRSKLVFDDVLEEVADIMGGPTLRTKSQREKNKIVWRYLRWHLIRDEAVKRNLTVQEWEDRRKPPLPTVAKAPADPLPPPPQQSTVE